MADKTPSQTQGILHYIPPISAFVPSRPSPSASLNPLQTQEPSNVLLWVGGLSDTYRSVSYPYKLASLLPPTWELAQACLSSSGHGWGHGSLGQDVAELAKIVDYFRNLKGGKGKVVLMGHSTGCQDGLHYVSSPVLEGTTRPAIDGLILQAPVSDREALVQETSKEVYGAANEMAARWIKRGKGEDILPFSVTPGVFGRVPISARRWLSLASPGPDHAGEDDYYSSDLPIERLRQSFGKVPKGTPLLILYGEKDEYVPQSVDRQALVRKWMGVVREAGSVVDVDSARLVRGASHNLNGQDEGVVEELCARVVEYLGRVERGGFETESASKI
ncbi:hypothetical protein M8818_000460 [Zalaria obscura]|uniref:Uncharacterized protein n=1 Tax=Zalaria obscura TaxID=2024903 RepID=A0ACC3SMX8_9PEZI